MNLREARIFIEKYALGIHTEAEHQQFLEWLNRQPLQEVEMLAQEYLSLSEKGGSLTIPEESALVNQIEKALDQYELNHEEKSSRSNRFLGQRFWYSSAAAVVILMAAAFWIMLPRLDRQKASTTSNEQKPAASQAVVPGSNKAVLILADGSSISLDDSRNGKVAAQGGTIISKLGNGQVVYKPDTRSTEIFYNTLSTPKGGQFQLTLPDGSNVWLNSSSSIRYPTAFSGTSRAVQVTGEAYFEITHNAEQPFLVNLEEIQIKVLGTHFNVNAYGDEPSKRTTLLQGSVSISNGGAASILKPGQQAQISKSGEMKLLNEVDVEEVVAWKNGYFSFSKADLPTVMRQLARWYDVDVTYEGSVPDRAFGGKISREADISEVLRILRETRVHFRIEDKKIIVTP